MKKKTLRWLVLALFACMIAPMMTSCEKDDDTPVKPTPQQPRQKDGKEPVTAVLTLAAGHFHGVRFHQDPVKPKVKYLKAIQKIKLRRVGENEWKIADDSEAKRFVVKANSIYGLWIDYYDAKGKRVNGSLIADGADKHHQHFFSAQNVVPFGDGVAENDDNDTEAVFEYSYWDTTPWDKTLNDAGTQMTGESNPVGLKGWFSFLKDRRKMNVRIELMHARDSKFINGEASPYYAPTRGQRASEAFEVTMNIPFVTLYGRGEEIIWNASEGTTYEQLTPKEQKIIRSIADAYQISVNEALVDFFHRLEVGGADDGSLWF